MFGLFKKPKSIFELAKELNKKVVFVIFEDNIYITLADKKPDGTITFRVYKDGRYRDFKLTIQPDQEFLLHSPIIEIRKYEDNQNNPLKYENSLKGLRDFLLNFDFELELKNPKDVVFKLLPYDLDAIIIVYPLEVLSKDTCL